MLKGKVHKYVKFFSKSEGLVKNLQNNMEFQTT